MTNTKFKRGQTLRIVSNLSNQKRVDLSSYMKGDTVTITGFLGKNYEVDNHAYFDDDELELIEDDGPAIRVGAHRVDTLIAIDCRLDRFSEMMEKREFINLVNEVGHMFADFKETLIREVERVRPGLCECSGATFECEHWGAHETVDKIISIIEK